VPGARGFVAHDELERLYDRAAVVAVPSYREGFGIVCAEAMAHGKPVVASAVGGLLDLVADEETGLHVPPGDVPALRAALERLLADPALRERMGEAARVRVRERFSWDAVTDATMAAYEETRVGSRA
jgi:glycosyltransferase involved in cell wall biosynthesis